MHTKSSATSIQYVGVLHFAYLHYGLDLILPFLRHQLAEVHHVDRNAIGDLGGVAREFLRGQSHYDIRDQHELIPDLVVLFQTILTIELYRQTEIQHHVDDLVHDGRIEFQMLFKKPTIEEPI